MKKLILMVLLLAGVVWAGEEKKEPKGKYAIVLQAGNETREGMVRATHALLYARELAEKGYLVALIYDGAGTGWVHEFRRSGHPLHQHYLKVKKLNAVEEICDYCAGKFGAKGSLAEYQKKLLVGEFEGHPSLVKWIERGYQIIVL